MNQIQQLSRGQVSRGKIAATVLSGSAADQIGAAIASALPWVDEVCLIDTGIEDNTRQVASDVAGSKLSIWSFPWCDDFGAARNAALHVASKTGATWAVTLDTDERLQFPDFRDRQCLSEALNAYEDVLVWMVRCADGSYVKERFLRVGPSLVWNGQVHEGLTGYSTDQFHILPGATFREEPKSPVQMQLKLHRDLALLQKETVQHPQASRWWFYLGQTYEGLEQPQAAAHAYLRCAQLDKWPDESGWACYCAARCLTNIATTDDTYRQAEEVCSLGMTRKPTMAELPWLAGWCCYQRSKYADAITWSRWAIQLADDTEAFNRALFRYQPAWREGPYDVLRYAYQHLNQPLAAQQAERRYQELVQRQANDR